MDALVRIGIEFKNSKLVVRLVERANLNLHVIMASTYPTYIQECTIG